MKKMDLDEGSLLLLRRAKLLALDAWLIDSHHLTFPEVAELLNHAGFYMRERGLYGPAELFLTRTLAMRELALGSEHPDTATTLHHLALLYYSLGQYEQAKTLYQRTLAIREQVLGPEHPDTAVFRGYTELLQKMQRIGK